MRKKCKYFDRAKSECANIIDRAVCSCEGNCAKCDFFDSIKRPECDHTKCAYNDSGVCVYAKAFGGANPEHGDKYACFVPNPNSGKVFTVTYTEHIVHHYEFEAEDSTEAEQLFWDAVSNGELDFSDGQLVNSDVEIQEKEK